MNAELIAEILDRGKDDWVDFAEVMSVVRSRTSLAEPAVVAMSVEVIDVLLNQQRIMVGDLLKQGDKVLFSPWKGPPKQIVERVQKDLAGLGHRPGIGDICWLSTCEVEMDQPKKTGSSRKAAYWIVASVMVFGSLAGLLTLGALTWFLKKDIHNAAFLAAAACAVLGIGLLLICSLPEGSKSTLIHLVHELGMAFAVSAIVLTAVEITIQVQHEQKNANHEREINKLNDKHKIATDRLNEEHCEKILEVTSKHTKKVGDLHIQHNKEQTKYFDNRAEQEEIRRHLLRLLDALASQDNRSTHEFKLDLRAFEALEHNKVEHEQLKRWKTSLLDKYGHSLFRDRNYFLAKMQFQLALQIDQEFAAKVENVDVLSYQQNVAWTHTRLAKAGYFCGEIHGAVSNQEKAVAKRNQIWTRFSEKVSAMHDMRNGDDRLTQQILKQYQKIQEQLDRDRKAEAVILAEYEAALKRWSDDKYTKGATDLKVGTGYKQGNVTNIEQWKIYKSCMKMGTAYRVDLTSDAADFDPFLVVRHSDPRKLMIQNDDIGGDNPDPTKRNYDSSISFVCEQDGDYWIIAMASPCPAQDRKNKTGEFKLQVIEVENKK